MAYVLEQKANVIITELSSSFGHLAIIIIPYLKCFSSKTEKIKTKDRNNNNYILHYSIFFLTYFCDLSLLMICSKIKPDSKKKNNIFIYNLFLKKYY